MTTAIRGRAVSRTTMQFIRRTRTPHTCQGCQGKIRLRGPALVKVEEGFDDENRYWKVLAYFHRLECYRARERLFGRIS